MQVDAYKANLIYLHASFYWHIHFTNEDIQITHLGFRLQSTIQLTVWSTSFFFYAVWGEQSTTERMWRYNDVIWQLFKLWICSLWKYGHSDKKRCPMLLQLKTQVKTAAKIRLSGLSHQSSVTCCQEACYLFYFLSVKLRHCDVKLAP